MWRVAILEHDHREKEDKRKREYDRSPSLQGQYSTCTANEFNLPAVRRHPRRSMLQAAPAMIATRAADENREDPFQGWTGNDNSGNAAHPIAEDSKELPMLVLSRRTNETLVIDNNIRFTVLSVHGNQVRIGIEAPEDVIVLREEIIHNGNGTRPRPANPQPADLATAQHRSYQPREQQPDLRSQEIRSQELRSSADAYRRHESSPEYNRGNEHGKRRGVLGLRRRRP